VTPVAPRTRFGSLRLMVTAEHAQQVIETYCMAESAKDRDTWLSLPRRDP
jgi:hypothetical protein